MVVWLWLYGICGGADEGAGFFGVLKKYEEVASCILEIYGGEGIIVVAKFLHVRILEVG